jgi:DNA invertase Pin-like site-specific DNA recombinase
MLRGHAASKGWKVVRAYKEMKTGTTLDRPELTKLLAEAQNKEYDVVLVTKLDRLSRSMKDFFEINEHLVENDIDLVVTTQNIDTTSSMGRFNRNVLMAFAEFERDMIAERTREKLFTQAQNGFWGGGVPPLGYDTLDKKLIVNKKGADLINKIFHYYLETPSTTEVARRLNSEGLVTKKKKSKGGQEAGGTAFTKESVKSIINSPVYIGLVRFNGQTFKGLHEPIVDEVTFNKVQQQVNRSVTDTKVTSRSKSPLTLLGIVRCGHWAAY